MSSCVIALVCGLFSNICVGCLGARKGRAHPHRGKRNLRRRSANILRLFCIRYLLWWFVPPKLSDGIRLFCIRYISFMVIRLTKMIITWHALASSSGDLETWTLRIRGAREMDRGGYECQVNILITIIGAIIINHHVRWTDRIFPRFFTAFIKGGFLLIPYIGAHTSYL